MPGRGRPPKDPDKRIRRNHPPEQTEIAADARPKRAPALGRSYRVGEGRVGYLEETRRWWKTWARSPQATKFTATDWQRLRMLAPLVDAFHREPDRQLLAEIRLNEERLGATVIDRQRLRWAIVDEPSGDRDEGDAPKRSRSRRDPRLQVIQGG